MRQGWESEAQNWMIFARTPGYDSSHEETNLPVLLDLLPPPGHRTLDLACGEGRLSRFLTTLGHNVVGADASPAMVRGATTHQDASPVLLADATELPFADASFDLVVAYMCLHDIDDMPGAVGEAARVMAPAGRLCVAIPHPFYTAGTFQRPEADAPFVITGSYLEPAPVRTQARRGGVLLTFHSAHRPLEVYVHALASAGLLTETIREVKASERTVSRDPDARRWQRMPLFLHLRAIKPG
jgi:SAM-dependent methyltransferase